MARQSTIQRLVDAGFDLSRNIPFAHAWRIRCSQCSACCINGIPCHETGCPNEPRDFDDLNELDENTY